MYSRSIKSTEEDIQNILKRVNELSGKLLVRRAQSHGTFAYCLSLFFFSTHLQHCLEM